MTTIERTNFVALKNDWAGLHRLDKPTDPFADGVNILRVLHSSRDLDALLSDELLD